MKFAENADESIGVAGINSYYSGLFKYRGSIRASGGHYDSIDACMYSGCYVLYPEKGITSDPRPQRFPGEAGTDWTLSYDILLVFSSFTTQIIWRYPQGRPIVYTRSLLGSPATWTKWIKIDLNSQSTQLDI